jgi:hypothetical protein
MENKFTTIFGSGAALFGYLATVVPGKYQGICTILAGCSGVLFAYFTKDKDKGKTA